MQNLKQYTRMFFRMPLILLVATTLANAEGGLHTRAIERAVRYALYFSGADDHILHGRPEYRISFTSIVAIDNGVACLLGTHYVVRFNIQSRAISDLAVETVRGTAPCSFDSIVESLAAIPSTTRFIRHDGTIVVKSAYIYARHLRSAIGHCPVGYRRYLEKMAQTASKANASSKVSTSYVVGCEIGIHDYYMASETSNGFRAISMFHWEESTNSTQEQFILSDGWFPSYFALLWERVVQASAKQQTILESE